MIAALALLLAGCQTGTKNLPAPLPATTAITPPGEDVPAAYAQFSGFWSGSWGDKIGARLAVQTIDAEGAVTGLYAVGANSSMMFASGSMPFVAKILDGKLVLAPLRNGTLISFTLRQDGKLVGRHDLGGVVSAGVFEKNPAGK